MEKNKGNACNALQCFRYYYLVFSSHDPITIKYLLNIIIMFQMKYQDQVLTG